jgi:hypothetical protein
VCPLAVIEWNDNQLQILADCRNPFDNLVELTRRSSGGCCTVTVRPEDLADGRTLQSIVDQFGHRDKVTICLMPGIYALDAPLRLGIEHSHLSLEGCHDGAVIRARAGAERNFLDGLIVLNRANDVTLRGLRFDLPLVPFDQAGGTFMGMPANKIGLPGLRTSIGVRPMHCARLVVRDCLFRFGLSPQQPVLGVGIFAGSECWGLTIENNRFVRDDEYLKTARMTITSGARGSESIFRMLIGYLLAPSARQPDR